MTRHFPLFLATLASTLPLLLSGLEPLDPSPWDFIVVGGGVAGCIVADILSASGRRVLLLESGPPGHAAHGGNDRPYPDLQQQYGRNLTRFDIPGFYHQTVWKEQRYNQPSTPWAYQANVLGGGGALNGALTMVPPKSDFLRLAPLGWSYEDVDPHFKQILSYMQAVNVPSSDGLRYLERPSSVLRHALQYLNFTSQPLNEEPEFRANTFNYPPVAAVEGQRMDTCLRFLPHERARPNFRLVTGAVVQRVVLGQVHGRAYGVEYYSISENITKTAELGPSGRVVLTAGALNTPRLLMMSGIGPERELQKLAAAAAGGGGGGGGGGGHQVPPMPPASSWVRAEAVGEALSDHVYLRMRFALRGYRSYNYANLSAASVEQYFRSMSGPVAQYGPVLAGYLASPFNGGSTADMEVFMEASDECTTTMPPTTTTISNSTCRNDIFEVYLMLLAPRSNTSLTLNVTTGANNKKTTTAVTTTSSSIAAVQVQPTNWTDMYLSDDLDRKVMRWGIERMVTAMLGVHGDDNLELLEPAAATPEAYDALLDSYSASHLEGNHWAGTCALGRAIDPTTMAVLGTENVHVADASILPYQLSSHPALSVAAMARRAAQLVLTSSGVAACASNPRCVAEGLVEGQCCPSFDAVMLSCCGAEY